MLTEAFAVYYAFNHLPPTCDTTVFRTHMLKLFRWYGILNPHINNHGIEAMDKIHELQASVRPKFIPFGLGRSKNLYKIYESLSVSAELLRS